MRGGIDAKMFQLMYMEEVSGFYLDTEISFSVNRHGDIR